MNGLLDKTIIAALYRASQTGVRIDLIVRGMCALRPGVRGVSDHIRVRSVVGRLLEHSRIFFFANGGQEEVYVGSADWMPRNLYERVEVIFPVQDPVLRDRLRNGILEAYLADDVKARVLRSDGTYVRAWQTGRAGRKPVSPMFNAQQFLIEVAEGKRTEKDIPEPRSGRKKSRPKLLLQA
jgi:polyphosphate kinase